MSRSFISHPVEEQLLSYLDGELPSGPSNEIRAHLEACWECRVGLEELQNTVTECVHYRKNVLQKDLPPPPKPWIDIYRQFDEIDASVEQDSLRERLLRALRWPARNTKKWAPVAVSLMAACILVYRFRQTPAVEAAELLRQAVAVSDASPSKIRRIQIRTKDRRLERRTGAVLKANSTGTDALEKLFASAHYDWKDPLSARSYQAWRDQLTDRREEVIEERDGYRIRTDTNSSELAEATLKLRIPELRPVEERLEFRNREWVEITELAEESAPPPQTLAAAGGANGGEYRKTPSVVASSMAPVLHSEPATAGDELRVWAALHKVGADLGDPIEVSRAPDGIVVTGVGIEPRRQQEIQDALSAQKHVQVRFSDPDTTNTEPETEAPAGDSVNGAGARASFAQLAAEVLDLSEPMMSRAYALRRLAERIPVSVEPELSATDGQVLRNLRREHVEALRRQAASIDRVLRSTLEPMAGTIRAESGSALSTNAWQPATEELFQAARRVDQSLAEMFGGSAAELKAGPLPGKLLALVARLRATIEAYDRLPVGPPERREP